MKNFIYFALAMLFMVILLPLAIVGSQPKQEDSVKTPEKKEEKKDAVTIKVYVSQENKLVQMELEEYVKGVVAAEMPADFEPEALKAQAAAARTYAYARMKKIYAPKDDSHRGADICTDSAHCQAWSDKKNLMKKWDAEANDCWAKINFAVEATRGIIILYGERIINPVFHSNSGGRTENSEEVWEGTAVPYLKSVFSAGEDVTTEFKSEVVMKLKDFNNTLKREYPTLKLSTANINDFSKQVKVAEYSEGGRVKILKVGNVNIKGTDFRRLLSLRSTNFNIKTEGKDSIRITTYGYGHGVGMSQWGANYMAKTGFGFQDIVKYYYQGVTLQSIAQYEKSR